MPRKRDRFLGLFSRSRSGSPAPPVQQSASSIPSFQTGAALPSSAQFPVVQASSATTMLHPHSYRSTSSRAVPPVEEVASVAWEGVKRALAILKECSDWLPQLKAATGGLVVLIGAIELTSSNAADMELLRQKIDRLTSIIKENSRDPRFPWLLRRLSDFAEKLNEVVRNVDKKSLHGKLRRFAEGNKDKGDITAFVGAVSDLVSNLQSELSLYTSRGINELLSSESLKKLKESEAACYNALLTAKLVQRRSCTPNTRQKILEDLMKWAKDPHSSRLYWMNGMAGTGKTTIAYSFCEQLQEKGLLGANFFSSRSLAECSDLRYIIPTTARQLARSCPQFASALLEVLRADSQLPSLGHQVKRLLSEPFRHITEPITDTLIVVIDALDECSNGSSEVHLFLEQICHYFSNNTIPLKVFITSRPEDVISRTVTPLKPSSSSEWSVIHIHDIEESLVQADIKVYVEEELNKIAKTRRLEGGWPPSIEVDVVVGNADKLFIYAATVIRYVGVDGGNPRRRLSQLASTSRLRKGTSQSPALNTQLIDELYRSILERAFHEKDAEENLVARMVLKLIVCAQTPLTLAGIVDLLNASDDFEFEILASDVRIALELLPSVISIPVDESGVASTFHSSFPDFLFDNRRCGPINHIPFRQSHQDLARLCLHLMDKSLAVDDISGSGRWQTVDAILNQTKIESWMSTALAYACIFWTSHIDTNDGIESLSSEIENFLAHQVLRWLEVLSLLRRLDIGVEVLQRMKEFEHPTLSSGFDDAYKYLKDIFDIIKVWPCEIYHSGLVWAPERSFIRKTYLRTHPFRIVCGRRLGWGACELTIRLQASVESVAVSHDNRHVVFGGLDGTVRIWNTSTGEERVLEGHQDWVTSVAVTRGTRHIVSGSRDYTVRIWNGSTGEEEHVLRGHSAEVSSVAVMPDNRHVVSASWDKTVRIWNASTGEKEYVLTHPAAVYSVAVTPDNRHIVSGSDDNTVRVWNAWTGEEEYILEGHSDQVSSVAVSHDSRFIVSGSNDNTVRIWNASTGQEERVLAGHSDFVCSVDVSPDNHHIVSGSWDFTVRVWNALTGELEQVLKGHSGELSSVAVSPYNRHVVSGSLDKTVRIWNVWTGQEEHVLAGHSDSVCSVAVSYDTRHVVSGSSDATVRIWNALTGEEEHVLEGHSGTVTSVAVTPDNRHIVSGSLDGTVRIWNAWIGKEEQVLGHSRPVSSVAVSPDNRHIVSGSWDFIVRIWNALTGELEQVLEGHSHEVSSVVVSFDNRRIVSGSKDSTVRIWNAWTGEEEHVLEGHSRPVCSVAVTPDNRHIVSGSWDNTIRIWDASTSEEELEPPLVISFFVSSGECYVVFGSQINQDQSVLSESFLSTMVASITLWAQAGKTMSIPVIRRLVSGEPLQLDIFLRAIWNRSSPVVPVTLTPDGSSLLLSNGEKCLAIPSTLRDIDGATVFGSKICFGHNSGQITILDIST